MPWDPVVAIKAARTAVRFVEGGPLGEALAELDLQAARSALEKAPDARDRRAQVWSAVNHLEGAQAAIESKLVGRRGAAHFAVRGGNFLRLAIRRGQILALMAVCYVYLGENELARQAVQQGRRNLVLEVPVGVRFVALGTGLVAGGPDWIRFEKANLDAVDWSAFELPPRA
jgi:hypothetical protein